MLAVLLNLKDLRMLYLSFAGLLLLGVVSPSLEPLDQPFAIYSAAALELFAALLFCGIAYFAKGNNALQAGWAMTTFSFINLSAHFGALCMVSKSGEVSDYYGMQLRVGESLQLLTAILFSLPVQMLGATVVDRVKRYSKRGNSAHKECDSGRRSMGPAWR